VTVSGGENRLRGSMGVKQLLLYLANGELTSPKWVVLSPISQPGVHAGAVQMRFTVTTAADVKVGAPAAKQQQAHGDHDAHSIGMLSNGLRLMTTDQQERAVFHSDLPDALDLEAILAGHTPPQPTAPAPSASAPPAVQTQTLQAPTPAGVSSDTSSVSSNGSGSSAAARDKAKVAQKKKKVPAKAKDAAETSPPRSPRGFATLPSPATAPAVTLDPKLATLGAPGERPPGGLRGAAGSGAPPPPMSTPAVLSASPSDDTLLAKPADGAAASPRVFAVPKVQIQKADSAPDAADSSSSTAKRSAKVDKPPRTSLQVQSSDPGVAPTSSEHAAKPAKKKAADPGPAGEAALRSPKSASGSPASGSATASPTPSPKPSSPKSLSSKSPVSPISKSPTTPKASDA